MDINKLGVDVVIKTNVKQDEFVKHFFPSDRNFGKTILA